MKQKKSKSMDDNVIDFRELVDQKKIIDMCELDDDEFKIAVTHSLLSIIKAVKKNNKKIDDSFERLRKHLKAVNEDQKFLKQVLYMERILGGELRKEPMTIEQKASLAKAFGIDYNKFIKQIMKKGKKTPSVKDKGTTK